MHYRTKRGLRYVNIVRYKIAYSLASIFGAMFFIQSISVAAGMVRAKQEFVSPVNPYTQVIQVPKYIEVEKEVFADCKTETCQIVNYIAQKFQDHSDEAIAMIRTCENGTFDPKRVSGLNVQKSGRRSYDVGIFQINADESNTVEIDRLKDWRYNVDQAYKKYKAHNNTFYLWTCATKIGQKNYIGGK